MHTLIFYTLGVFLSVFLLTRTGLSYLTRDAFGGIIPVFASNVAMETNTHAQYVHVYISSNQAIIIFTVSYHNKN